MDAVKLSVENVPLESSSEPEIAYSDVDQSSASTSRTFDGETGLTESVPKELEKRNEDNNGKNVSESISSSTQKLQLYNAPVTPTDKKNVHVGEQSAVKARTPSKAELKISEIDTTAPFKSVKAAVSKFGGIVDWKALRAQTAEKRKVIVKELKKTREEIPLFKKQAEDAEEAKIQVLKELDSTNRLVEELKVNLERAQKEEEQAKQDSELAMLRVEEIEQGIADEASTAAKTQLEVAKARHEASVSELKSVKGELEQLKQDYVLLVAEKDASLIKAEEAVSASKEVEKSVEDLTIELITAKEALESAHAAHMEAEEHRIGAVLAKDKDMLNWEKDLEQAKEELEKINQQILDSEDLKSKLDTATALLQDLKSELTAYMDEEAAKEGNLQDSPDESRKNTRADVKATLASAKHELDEVNLKIEKAVDEVNILKMAATSLKSELEKENAELAAIQQREGMASAAVASLETELNRTKSEIAVAQVKEREDREKMVELPKQLEVVAQEADRAKALVEKASDTLNKAKEEAEQTKAASNTIESRLDAVQKEIEAAKASEKLALAAVNALVESESAQMSADLETDSQTGVTLSLEEYYELSKRAHEAEEQANIRVTAAFSQIEVAKELESKSLKKLEVANQEMAEKKLALETALRKSDIAKQGKPGIEQDLRKWRSDNELTRKSAQPTAAVNSNAIRKTSIQSDLAVVRRPNSSVYLPTSSPISITSNAETDSSSDLKMVKKKKKSSFFPKIFKFLGKKKSQASKS